MKAYCFQLYLNNYQYIRFKLQLSSYETMTVSLFPLEATLFSVRESDYIVAQTKLPMCTWPKHLNRIGLRCSVVRFIDECDWETVHSSGGTKCVWRAVYIDRSLAALIDGPFSQLRSPLATCCDYCSC